MSNVNGGMFVIDPRRLPRVPARCRVDLVSGIRRWRADSLDVGPGGCQIVSPHALGTGAQVGLLVVPTPGSEALSVTGRIAWASALAPVRLGVAFVPPGARAATWFQLIVNSQPQLIRALSRVPDRIPANAMLYLGPPPREIFDFTASELLVLRNLGDGATAQQLRERLDTSWNASRAALFALIARRCVTLSASEAARASQWRAALLDAELAAALNALPGKAQPPGIAVTLPHSGNGRPPKAQHHLERALDDIASGRLPDAIAHVRIAASMAPKDGFIRQVLGRLSPGA